MTARLTLVRHGRAASGFSDDLDPGLHADGVAQALAMADALRSQGPAPIVTSPLRRTRETAAALADVWGVVPVVEPRVGEIPSPTDDLEERGRWLASIWDGRWTDLGPELHRWRDDVLDAVLELDRDTVVVTHFVAINAIVGEAEGDDRFVVFSPTNCSRTVVEHDGTSLRVLALGEQAVTEVR